MRFPQSWKMTLGQKFRGLSPPKPLIRAAYVGLLHYSNNNKKSRNIHQQNPNHNPSFYQVKLENYDINVTPDKYSSRKVKEKLTLLFSGIWATLYVGPWT